MISWILLVLALLAVGDAVFFLENEDSKTVAAASGIVLFLAAVVVAGLGY